MTGTTVDAPRQPSIYRESVHIDETTIDPPRLRPATFEQVKITEETVDYPRHVPASQKVKMGYYDDDGKRSFPPPFWLCPLPRERGINGPQATTTRSATACTSLLTDFCTPKVTTRITTTTMTRSR